MILLSLQTISSMKLVRQLPMSCSVKDELEIAQKAKEKQSQD